MKDLEQIYLDEYNSYMYSDVEPIVPEVIKQPVVSEAIAGGMQSVKSEVQNNPAEAAVAGAKGAVQGAIGLPGDLISLVRGVASAVQTPEGKSKLDEFLVGLEKETGLPTTEDVKMFIDTMIGKANAPATETLGEIMSPAGVATKAVKLSSKAIKSMKAKK